MTASKSKKPIRSSRPAHQKMEKPKMGRKRDDEAVLMEKIEKETAETTKPEKPKEPTRSSELDGKPRPGVKPAGEDITEIWKRRPDIWVKDVIGIGSGKCNCSPPCKMDPSHAKILKEFGDLIHAKRMIFAVDVLSRRIVDVARAKERLDVLNKNFKEMKKSGNWDPKNQHYRYVQAEINRITNRLRGRDGDLKKIEYMEKVYGWARKKIGVSIQSSKGVGKTALLSWVNMYFYSLFTGSKGIVTAPKKDLLEDNLKSEIKKWIRHSQQVYGESSLLSQMFTVSSDKMYANVENEKDRGNTQLMAFRTANLSAPKDVQEQTLQGYHEDFMLLSCDEASGVNDVVFKPLIATLTSKVNLLFIIFNPNKNTGFAIETQTRLKGLFLTYQLNSLNSTLITKDYIENMRKYYEDDPNGWRVNILGLPPKDDKDALIPYEKIIEAAERETPYELYKDNPRVGGFDVGGGGDPSAIAVVQGCKCHAIHEFSSSIDTEIEQFGVDTVENELIERIGCDGIGIGFFMASMLRKYNISAFSVDSRNKVSNPKYFNMRAKLYWELRLWIMKGGDIPNNTKLIHELAVLRKVGDISKIQIISKEKLKKEGIKSPNRADALMLAMFFKQLLQIISNIDEKKRDKYRESYQRKYSEASLKNWLTL